LLESGPVQGGGGFIGQFLAFELHESIVFLDHRAEDFAIRLANAHQLLPRADRQVTQKDAALGQGRVLRYIVADGSLIRHILTCYKLFRIDGIL